MHTDMDAIASQLPLDPFISMGLITFAAGGVGWLVGPIVGTGVFNWRNRQFRAQMDEKEKEFYKRVKKFRVDPSVSSLANPVPGTSFGPRRREDALGEAHLFDESIRSLCSRTPCVTCD